MEGEMGWFGQDTKKEHEQGETSSIELQPRHKGRINPSRTAQDTQISDTQTDIRPFVQITRPLPLYTSLKITKRYNSLSELISAEYSYEPKLEGAWFNWIVWTLAILGLAGSWSFRGSFVSPRYPGSRSLLVDLAFRGDSAVLGGGGDGYGWER
jgi:hypothetical protein